VTRPFRASYESGALQRFLERGARCRQVATLQCQPALLEVQRDGVRLLLQA
jgi:hypothetical protein